MTPFLGHWGYPVTLHGREKELINVRMESIREKPHFQQAAKLHRCVILADGFFEWRTKKLSSEMRPFFSIITVPANATMQSIHDRMPFILLEAHEYTWLTVVFIS